eukprot:COSAG02_NODE_747_length_17723_cov_49.509816_1_plen_84_part_00
MYVISCGYLALLKQCSLTLSINYFVTQPCPYNTPIKLRPALPCRTSRQGDRAPHWNTGSNRTPGSNRHKCPIPVYQFGNTGQH